MIVGDTSQTVNQAQTAGQSQSSTIAESNGLASDFDTFLQLLTAQIRNQDPLNPADSTEFVAQLATFSNVEQSVQTNDLLKDLSAQMSVQSIGQMSGWVGMEARAAMPVVLDGSEKTLYLNTPVVADAADLVVRDLAGEVVQTIAIDPDSATYAWSGRGADGSQLANGTYNLSVESRSGESVLGPSSVETYAPISEAALVDGQVVLRFPGDIGLPSTSVLGVRSPN